MAKLFRLLGAILMLFLLAGCAGTTPSLGDYYQPTLADSQYQHYARVYLFYPDPNATPGQLTTSLYIKGNKVVDLPNSGYTIIYLQPGAYLIETLPYNLLTNERVDAGLKFMGNFKADHSYYVGIIDRNGSVPIDYFSGSNMSVSMQNAIVETKLVLFSENAALPKISLCRYVAPNLKVM